jgi:hypothetical protein
LLKLPVHRLGHGFRQQAPFRHARCLIAELPMSTPARPAALPTQEQGIASIRTQLAVVRALIDELDQVLPDPHRGAVRGQVAEELARLGNTLLKAAGRLARIGPGCDDGRPGSPRARRSL